MDSTYKLSSNFIRVFFAVLILLLLLCKLTSLISSIPITETENIPCTIENISLISSSPHKSFAQVMQTFPWNQYQNATNSNNIPDIQNLTEYLLNEILIPFIIKESSISVNTDCQAPPLLKPELIGKCSRLKKPRKIGVLLNFGFDVDALELHLQELDEIVDKFFLIEGTKIHNRYLDSKPSIWDKIKYTHRFSRFRHKIVHFIIDDAAYSTALSSKLWDREYLQGQLRLEKFLKWNSNTNYFSSHDLIGIGDTDEIPNRNVINFLKNCELQSNNGSVDIGIWYPFPYVDTIFPSDFPVPGHPFTFGNPTYWTLTALNNLYDNMDNKNIPASTSGNGGASVLGGIHFSQYPYLPFQLIKLLTGGGRQLDLVYTVVNIGLLYASMKGVENKSSENMDVIATKAWVNVKTKEYANRIKSVDWFRNRYGNDEANAIIKVPWFYECNPERFSSFAGKHDERLNGNKK